MEGVDIHLDVSVGQQLSALGHTLTMLTGSEEDDANISAGYDSDDVYQPDSDNGTNQFRSIASASSWWTEIGIQRYSHMCRQSSLPNAGSELSFLEGDLEWPDTIDIGREQIELRRKHRKHKLWMEIHHFSIRTGETKLQRRPCHTGCSKSPKSQTSVSSTTSKFE